MKINEIITEDTQLDELRQDPSSYGRFLNSSAADGIMAGFEAELIFPGVGRGNSYDYDVRVQNIDDVINFLDDSDSYGSEFLESLHDDLTNDYDRWSDEKFEGNLVKEYVKQTGDWDEIEAVERYLANERYTRVEINNIIDAYRKSVSRDKVDHGLVNQNDLSLFKKASDAAFEEVEDEFEDDPRIIDGADDYGMKEWFLEQGWSSASDVIEYYGVESPYNTDSDFNIDGANELADSLSDTLGVPTKADDSYHGTKRDAATWIFEPDGSLRAEDSDDMPVEIVSPPMPLKECLTKLQEFFAWADQHDAYTNSSTGFHMSVSLPKHDKGNIDFVKLALFLGEERVLQEFGRLGNSYCQQVLPRLRTHISKNPNSAAQALDSLKLGLSKIASQIISPDQKFEKFFTINPKENYVEFRSAGGYNYHDSIKKLQNTLSRYAQALYVAGHPEEEKNEYAKKLYKLLSPSEDGTDTIKELAKLSAGKTTDGDIKSWYTKMKSLLKQSQDARKSAQANNPVDATGKNPEQPQQTNSQ